MKDINIFSKIVKGNKIAKQVCYHKAFITKFTNKYRSLTQNKLKSVTKIKNQSPSNVQPFNWKYYYVSEEEVPPYIKLLTNDLM